MKKIFSILLVAVCSLTAVAQPDNNTLNKTWGKGRYTRLGYAWSQTADEYSPADKSKFSFFLTKGTTYYFPKKPIANMLKIGIDATWFDIQVSKYGNAYSDLKWSSEFEPVQGPDVYDEDGDFDEEGELFDLDKIGTWGLSFAMGIGPNVSIAPFALTNIKIMQPLRVSVYFHYDPTVMLYMRSQNSDIELSTAYVNMMDLGVNLHYRKIGIGYEARWGNGKFKPLDFSAMLDENGESLGTEKYTRRFANNRIYLQFTF
ncbi:MAG: hypothetical protein NC301_08015 [Bacteroides sp.]|nr:hypothetical protein [Bacteroides sp.]MCM1379442.1 hypothetical protein [Bacteroides sp.]MCM1445303.1 hypothetical protein [Prevotella sp.]